MLRALVLAAALAAGASACTCVPSFVASPATGADDGYLVQANTTEPVTISCNTTQAALSDHATDQEMNALVWRFPVAGKLGDYGTVLSATVTFELGDAYNSSMDLYVGVAAGTAPGNCSDAWVNATDVLTGVAWTAATATNGSVTTANFASLVNSILASGACPSHVLVKVWSDGDTKALAPTVEGGAEPKLAVTGGCGDAAFTEEILASGMSTGVSIALGISVAGIVAFLCASMFVR